MSSIEPPRASQRFPVIQAATKMPARIAKA
jgi:hypothetical protein